MTRTTTTYVLVHGAWGGAHTWRRVRPGLWSAGHHVFTPSLTGIGERSHLTSPHVDLTVHVDDVVNCVLYEDLDDMVLLGFSYGGMVVTGALEHVGDRVRELVYLDAFVPDDGQSVADLTATPGLGSGIPAGRGPGEDWLIPPRDRAFDDPAETEFHGPRRSPQPSRTFTEPVHLVRPLESYAFGRTFIKAAGDIRHPHTPDAFWAAADRYREHPSWRYEELPGNHMIPQNHPDALVDILLSLA